MDAAVGSRHHLLRHRRRLPAGRARLTSYGRTEEVIGRWLGSRRDEFIIATKCFAPTGPKPWDSGNSRKNIVRALDASLRRLGTDYVDLYQLHFWDADTPIDETLQALDDVVRSGKVRYIGCSNFLAYQLARSIGRAEVLRTASFVSVQPRYNLLFRVNERELLPLCVEEGIAVIPYNPLAGGLPLRQAPAGRADRGWQVHARRRRRPLPGALLARPHVQDDRGTSPDRRSRRRVDGHAGRAVGSRQPGDHEPDHRREPTRSVEGLDRRSRRSPRHRRQGSTRSS